MGAYSFQDVQASIDGPGGAFSLSGVGNAEEGISIEPTGDKNGMTIGADGKAMHSLYADRSGTVTVRLQRTSTANSQLQNLYNYQTTSARYHGQNTIVVRNPISGDVITCTEVAFAKQPPNAYAKDAGNLEWTFHAGIIDTKLGTGTPEVE
jgi:hypothetical protein